MIPELYFIVNCESDSSISSILQLREESLLKEGDILAEFFSQQELVKFMGFVLECNSHHFAYLPEAAFKQKETEISLSFLALKAKNQQGLLILAEEKSETTADKLCQAAMKFNQQGQKNLFNTAQGLQENYEELTAINNELINSQRELARKNSELARVSAEKSRIISVLAHDLRNPLGGIKNLLDLLINLSSGKLSPREKEILLTIKQASTDSLDMLEDLLDIYRYREGKLQLKRQNSQLSRLVLSLLRIYEIMAEDKKIKLKRERFNLDIEIDIDQSKIKQVIANLLTNAIKYSPKGEEIKLSLYKNKDKVFFEVKDNGPGLKAEEQEKLFNPFYTVKSVKSTAGEKSVGLGLALARDIVSAHKGKISVESRKGEGALFRVELPLIP